MPNVYLHALQYLYSTQVSKNIQLSFWRGNRLSKVTFIEQAITAKDDFEQNQWAAIGKAHGSLESDKLDVCRYHVDATKTVALPKAIPFPGNQVRSLVFKLPNDFWKFNRA